MHQLGLVSISFRDRSPEELLDAVKASGLSCIEWGSDVHAPCGEPERLHRIARMQEAAGIACSSYGTYFRLGRDDPELLHSYIEGAKTLGTNILRLWCGVKGHGKYAQDELQTLYRDCRRAAQIACDSGVILCMECHNGTVTDTKEGALALMQAVDSPAFGMYWQPNQLRSVQENLSYAKLLAPWTRHVHVFNWHCGEDGALRKEPLTQAVNVWKQYLRNLPGDRTLLLEFMPDNKLESLIAEADALRSIVRQ